MTYDKPPCPTCCDASKVRTKGGGKGLYRHMCEAAQCGAEGQQIAPHKLKADGARNIIMKSKCKGGAASKCGKCGAKKLGHRCSHMTPYPSQVHGIGTVWGKALAPLQLLRPTRVEVEKVRLSLIELRRTSGASMAGVGRWQLYMGKGINVSPLPVKADHHHSVSSPPNTPLENLIAAADAARGENPREASHHGTEVG
tara:strand:- start:41 stop:634 length:594 start_codon:yes stop_codon:yes gene_type:complete